MQAVTRQANKISHGAEMDEVPSQSVSFDEEAVFMLSSDKYIRIPIVEGIMDATNFVSEECQAAMEDVVSVSK